MAFVFEKHEYGNVLGQDQYVVPLASHLLAAVARNYGSNVNASVHDANHPKEQINYETIAKNNIVCFTTWYSNSKASIDGAKQVKQHNPKATVVFGGPGVSSLAANTLRNNKYIDFVVEGGGEQAVIALARNSRAFINAPGVAYRDPRRSQQIHQTSAEYSFPLDEIPLIDPGSSFSWNDQKKSGHEAFPLSMYRGCFKSGARCEYCAIKELKTRSSSAEKFWEQVIFLEEKYGVDYFFETADIFPMKQLSSLLQEKPSETNASFRAYYYPGQVRGNKDCAKQLEKIGFRQLFTGVESSLYIGKASGNRKYKNDFKKNLFQEFNILADHGISVMPSFIFGLPGETPESIKQTSAFIHEIANLPNVTEMSINKLVVLPGSIFFEKCVADADLAGEYEKKTKNNLIIGDQIQYDELTDLFIRKNAQVDPDRISSHIVDIAKQLHPVKVANWEKKV